MRCRSGVEKGEGQYYGNEQTVYAAGAKFPLFICESLTKANRAVLSRSLNVHARMCAKLLQLCQTFCGPMDCSPPGFSVHGVLYVGILKWVASPSSGDLPHPGTGPSSPALQADRLHR